MQEILAHLPQVIAAYTIYLVAVLSPGPAVLAIISASLAGGRRTGLTLAAGVFAGSFTWAMAAALGLAALLQTYAHLLEVVKMIGGLYLLYLAFKALRSAMRKDQPDTSGIVARSQTGRQVFLRGYAIHLTNPKAIFAWVAIISLGLPPGASPEAVAFVVGGCLLTGSVIFSGYALIFSTAGALSAYKAARRWIDGTMAVLFTLAGAKLMLTRI